MWLKRGRMWSQCSQLAIWTQAGDWSSLLGHLGEGVWCRKTWNIQQFHEHQWGCIQMYQWIHCHLNTCLAFTVVKGQLDDNQFQASSVHVLSLQEHAWPENPPSEDVVFDGTRSNMTHRRRNLVRHGRSPARGLPTALGSWSVVDWSYKHWVRPHRSEAD